MNVPAREVISILVLLTLAVSPALPAHGAPASPSVSAIPTPGGVTLSWDPVGDAVSYDIEYRLSARTTAEIAPTMKPLIIGGQVAPISNHPWQVALILRSSASAYQGQFCGGSLIAPSWVLTAAHCVDDFPTIDIGHGQGSLSDMVGTFRIPVAHILIHPAWNRNIPSSDLALLRLANPVPSGKPIAIPDQDHETGPGEIVWASGWGNTDPFASPSGWPDDLHEVLLDVLAPSSATQCGNWDGTLFNGVLHICAGKVGQWQGSCVGDSGGPLSNPNPGTQRWELAGVTSWGSSASAFGCSHPDFPSVYARVSHSNSWITSIVPDTKWEPAASTPNLEFDLQGLTQDYRYDVRVRAVDAVGGMSEWTTTTITAGVQGQAGIGDEIFFYRSSDGAYRYYDMQATGSLGQAIRVGSTYSLGWDSITAIDLDGDNADEIFFYRSSDGAYRYYDIKPDGRLGTLLQGGFGYSLGWDSITAIDLGG